MKLTVLKSISIVIIGMFLFSSCANYYKKKGTKSYDNYQFVKSISYFKKSIKAKDNTDTRVQLANAYREINDYKNALTEYEYVVNNSKNYAPAVLFQYGKMLMNTGKSKAAARAFESYLKLIPNDVVAQMLLASCNSVEDFKVDTTLYTLKLVDFSQFKSAFSPIPYKDGIVFSADKEAGMFDKTSAWTGSTYIDLYFSQKDKNGQWLTPTILKGDINGQYHEGPATFNKDGNKVFFTRSNYFKRKLQKNDENTNNLKIFSAELKEGKWTNLQEFTYNSDDYSCGHPTLSADGKTLYFVSDMPGGFGGTDLYKSEWTGLNWGKPENLGKEVNTKGNEMFPFLHEDNTLYFSSNAHNTMGGLDVFATSYDGKKWLQVENLNYPLNSNKDDFGFVLKNDGKTGFVSSNRTEDDKIYEFTKNDPTFKLNGIVIFKDSRKPFPGATVDIYNNTFKSKMTIVTTEDGKFSTVLKMNSDYTTNASKEGYFTKGVDVSTKDLKISKTFDIIIEMEEIIIEKPIVLENIYYDLDKAFIRDDAALELDKLVRLLQDNPNINIEMSSHTDSRAGDNYNLILSDKRAKSAVAYLVKRGIAASRLTWKGYGETKLRNRCKNNVECTEEEHQLNRRTEFKVVKIEK